MSIYCESNYNKMNNMLLALITALSITSIVMHSINLVHHHEGCVSSIVSIVFLSLMFVTPMLKRFIGNIGQWIFIVVACGSLVSQAYAYGEHIDEDSNVILGISVISTVLASFLGHWLKKKKVLKKEVVTGERDMNSMFNKNKLLQASNNKEWVYSEKNVLYYITAAIVKFVCALVSLIILIVLLAEETYSSSLDAIIVLTISGLLVYISLAALVAFVSVRDQIDMYVEFLCGIGPRIRMFQLSGKTTETKIVSSAVVLAGISSWCGNTLGDVRLIIALGFYVLALVADHAAVMYFKEDYIKKIKDYKSNS